MASHSPVDPIELVRTRDVQTARREVKTAPLHGGTSVPSFAATDVHALAAAHHRAPRAQDDMLEFDAFLDQEELFELMNGLMPHATFERTRRRTQPPNRCDSLFKTMKPRQRRLKPDPILMYDGRPPRRAAAFAGDCQRAAVQEYEKQVR